MGILNWMLEEKDTKSVLCSIPMPMYHAMQTMAYINSDQGITVDRIIIDALDEYLKKRVWATNEMQNSTEIKRAPSFRQERKGTGSSQMR